MKARYCGAVVGVFLQAVGSTVLAAPTPNGAQVTGNTVPQGVAPAAIAPAVVARPIAPAATIPRAVAGAEPRALAPAALTTDGPELDDESGMFGGGESQVLSVAPSQDLAPAPAPPRTWLRQPHEAKGPSAEQTKDSGVSLTVAAFLLLGALAGGAIFMRVKRPGAKPWLPAAPVRVLSTTKIGPKATLVTADIHGRVMLLGVTEGSVTELGWLDAASDTDGVIGRELDDDVPQRRSEPPSSVASPSRAAFGQALNNVFGNEGRGKELEFRGNPSVAALIAARETRDVVTTSFNRGGDRRGAGAQTVPESGRVETQVAGLMRRRR